MPRVHLYGLELEVPSKRHVTSIFPIGPYRDACVRKCHLPFRETDESLANGYWLMRNTLRSMRAI